MQLWKLMKVGNLHFITVPSYKMYKTNIMIILANEIMAIESVRRACQQMGVKEFFQSRQLVICVGIK